MANDEFKCTKEGECFFAFCVVKTKEGINKCEYLQISSDVDDEMRG